MTIFISSVRVTQQKTLDWKYFYRYKKHTSLIRIKIIHTGWSVHIECIQLDRTGIKSLIVSSNYVIQIALQQTRQAKPNDIETPM